MSIINHFLHAIACKRLRTTTSRQNRWVRKDSSLSRVLFTCNSLYLKTLPPIPANKILGITPRPIRVNPNKILYNTSVAHGCAQF